MTGVVFKAVIIAPRPTSSKPTVFSLRLQHFARCSITYDNLPCSKIPLKQGGVRPTWRLRSKEYSFLHGIHHATTIQRSGCAPASDCLELSTCMNSPGRCTRRRTVLCHQPQHRKQVDYALRLLQGDASENVRRMRSCPQ